MHNLLLVEDDRFVAQALVKLLRAEGYGCVCVHTAVECRRALAQLGAGEAFDLLLLDVGLPDGDGFALCRQIRAEHRMPIILLTARGETTDKVVGLEVGADDYVTKPFEPRELIARVRAHLRREAEYHGPPQRDRAIRLGELVIDPDRQDALLSGRAAQLTQREFELLHLLARHAGKALAAEWIFETVWGYEPTFGVKPLTVCIGRLRRKLEEDPARPRYLETVYGFGYRLGGPKD